MSMQLTPLINQKISEKNVSSHSLSISPTLNNLNSEKVKKSKLWEVFWYLPANQRSQSGLI